MTELKKTYLLCYGMNPEDSLELKLTADEVVAFFLDPIFEYTYESGNRVYFNTGCFTHIIETKR